jgi:antitoxin component of MazEF toxin-antitoxin module
MPKEVTINKWGNSLGVRIPQFIVDNLDLKKGDIAVMYYSEHKITIEVGKSSEETFDEYLATISPLPPLD